MNSSGNSFFKRGTRWYIEYTDGDGKRKQRSTGCTQKSEALKALTGFKELTAYTPPTKMFSTADHAFHKFRKCIKARTGNHL